MTATILFVRFVRFTTTITEKTVYMSRKMTMHMNRKRAKKIKNENSSTF